MKKNFRIFLEFLSLFFRRQRDLQVTRLTIAQIQGKEMTLKAYDVTYKPQFPLLFSTLTLSGSSVEFVHKSAVKNLALKAVELGFKK